MIKHKGLGRGLENLLGADEPIGQPGIDAGAPRVLPLSRLQAGRYQPRTRMDESALQELAGSIAQHGLMQPILVRPLLDSSVPARNQRYEIIAGERRFRAAGLAGLYEVPVIVKDVPDEQALAMALIENIQREDLNPLEEAQAIRRLIDEFDYSHEKAAEAIGRSRSATSNLLRLLNLADPVQTMLLAGDLDMGHARALLALDRGTQTMLAQQVVQKRLSVRDTESLVQRTLTESGEAVDGQPAKARRAGAADGDRDLARLQEKLADTLAADVTLQSNSRGGGKMVIRFGNHEQFAGLLQRMGIQVGEE